MLFIKVEPCQLTWRRRVCQSGDGKHTPVCCCQTRGRRMKVSPRCPPDEMFWNLGLQNQVSVSSHQLLTLSPSSFTLALQLTDSLDRSACSDTSVASYWIFLPLAEGRSVEKRCTWSPVGGSEQTLAAKVASWEGKHLLQ